jgi:UDP-glucuronate 4-epimerase
MSEERFLVTGALGCIGAWTVRLLVKEGISTAVFDMGDDLHRLRLILDEDELARVRFISGDVADFEDVERALKDSQATHLIHLAAIQVPFCKADPVRGARVNVVGTVSVFEAAKRLGLQRVVYASSIAVYGLSEEYPEGLVNHEAALKPRNHYGVYKQANEGTARIYWLDDGVTSLGLRPYTVYGPGRDQGLTSGPSKAMLAAAAQRTYKIPFGGQGAYQYAEDVARTFIQAARVPFEGAQVFNLRGSVVSVDDIIRAIETAEPSSRGRITSDEQALPLPTDVDDQPLRAVLGEIPETSLEQGVAQTLETFRGALRANRIDVDKILG